MQRFFDLKVAFRDCLKTDKLLPLKTMAAQLDITMERPHSGIDDCLTITQILKQLVRQPEGLISRIRSDADIASRDLSRSQ